jgi:hypothetical protein
MPNKVVWQFSLLRLNSFQKARPLDKGRYIPQIRRITAAEKVKATLA